LPLTLEMDNKANKNSESDSDLQSGNKTGSFAKRALGLATAVSFEIAVMTLSGYYLGRFLDEKFATAPWLMLVCVLVGLAVGFFVVIKTVKRFL